MNQYGREKICERVAVCWRCGKVVNGEVVFHTDEDLTYLAYVCPEDGRCEQPICKGRPSVLDTGRRKTPSYWPRLEVRPGQDWNDTNVVNRKNIPVLVFVTTTVCNSSCKICGVSDFSDEHRRHADLSLLKEKLSFYKKKDIILCGGEPTTREDLFEIIELVNKSGNTPVIQTNGLRLAEEAYVKKIKQGGVRHVRLSFDGFDEKIYERIRGGRHEYSLKMKALDNLIKEDFLISLASVVMKRINESQAGKIIEFAGRTRNVVELYFLCFSLTQTAARNKFDAGNMLSEDEIRSLILESMNMEDDYFELWDRLKIELAFMIDKFRFFLPFMPLPVFRNGIMYVKRDRNGIAPLLDKSWLNRLVDSAKNNRKAELVYFSMPIIARMALRNCLFPSLKEGLFCYKENAFKISVVSPLSTHLFRSNSLATFGFFDPDIGVCNSIHQR